MKILAFLLICSCAIILAVKSSKGETIVFYNSSVVREELLIPSQDSFKGYTNNIGSGEEKNILISDAKSTDGDGVISDVFRERLVTKITNSFPDNSEVMIAIAYSESGMKSDSVHTNKNGSVDVGLFQINSIHGFKKDELLDADINISVAKKIYEQDGLSAWSSYKNGSYKQFLR